MTWGDTMKKLAAGALIPFLAILLVATLPAAAQGIHGSLRGEVVDPSGAVVPGAKVTLTNEETSVKVETETTSVGTFFVPNLLAGRYTVTVEFQGFKRLVRKSIEVRGNQVAEVTLALELGATEQVVEVVANAELVSTTTSDLATAWQNRQVTELPNFSATGVVSDPRNLAILQAGVTSQPGGVVGEGGSIGGNRPRNNNFVLDGVDNNDITVTGALQPVISDAVEEFTLLTNQFSAEYGHSTAGQFIITTKSGTNDIHGRAWWFTQNKKLDAVDNLVSAALQRGDISQQPRRDFNRVGGQVGGPIQKEKWFLFGAFEYQVFGESGIPSVQVFAPTAAGYGTLAGLGAISATNLGVLQTFVPAAAAATGTVTVGGTPIPIGPLAVTVENKFRQYDWQANMDYVTARHRFSGRFLFNRLRLPNLFEGIFPQFVGTVFSDNRSVQYSDVFTLSPRFINEFRFGYRRSSNSFAVPTVTPPGALDAFPNLEIDELNLNIGPEGNSPQGRTQNTYQFVDQITYVRGAHTLKAGIDVRNITAPSFFLPRDRGEYGWATLNTFLADQVPDGSNGALRGAGSGFFAGNQEALFGFLQDDWRLHPRFTLNLGLRYEWVNIPRDAGLQALNAVANVPGVLEFRQPKTDTNNWAPRIGFAWDVFGDHKTAVRGGFALAYDILFQNFTSISLPPQLATELSATSVCAPTFPAPPAWCATGTGFIAGGGLPAIFLTPGLTPAEARSLTSALIPDSVSPKVLSWSLGIEREFLKDWVVEARYVGTRGLNLPVQIRRNPQFPLPLAAPAGQGLLGEVGPLAGGSLPVFTTASQVPANMGGALTLGQLCDPFGIDNFGLCLRPLLLGGAGFNGGFITAFDPAGASQYHGGSLSVERRFAQGLFLRGAYTFSKNIDTITNEFFTSFLNPRRPQDPLDLRGNRGLSDLDRTHHFALSWIYEVPGYKGENSLLRKAASGWQVTGTYFAESGQPVTLLSPDDTNGDLDFAGDRAFLNPNGIPNTGTGSSWVCVDGLGNTSIVPQFSPACPATQVVGYVANDPTAQFIGLGPGALSNLGRNTFRSPGLNNWNLGLFKNTYWNEDKGRFVQFRLEMFNAFNHPQYAVGGGDIFINTNNSFNFPYVTPGFPGFLDKRGFSGGNRLIQFGVKVIF